MNNKTREKIKEELRDRLESIFAEGQFIQVHKHGSLFTYADFEEVVIRERQEAVGEVLRKLKLGFNEWMYSKHYGPNVVAYPDFSKDWSELLKAAELEQELTKEGENE